MSRLVLRPAIAFCLLTVCATYAADLPARIAAQVAAAPQAIRGAIGVEVLDLTTHKTIYSYNEQQLFLPASNMKLFTAAAALTRLGGDAVLTTTLVREPSGSVVLVGGGDPSMSARVYPYDKTATSLPSLHAIDELADQAVAGGLRRVDGDVVGDDRRYAWQPFPESWTADDAQHEYGAPVSALSLNDNVVTIVVRPGANPREAAPLELDPPFEYFAIDNRVSTVGGTINTVKVTRVPGSRQIVLSGMIGTGAPAARNVVAVDDPALFAAAVMYDALLRRGVTIRGHAVARHRIGGTTDVVGQVLASRTSPPLSELLRGMLKVSQNLHAEMLLRELSRAHAGPGSASGQGTASGQAQGTAGPGTIDDGLREIGKLLEDMHVSAADWRSEDGSGLARNDQVTPRAIVQLLVWMDAHPQRELWRSLLPAGGQDGTLSDRLCCTSDTVAIRAKTGTLARAIALSGYADSPANGHLAFSILVNNFGAASADVRAWVDRLASSLVE